MEDKKAVSVKKESNTAWGWWALGLVMPIAGYVLYLVWKNKKEKESLSSGWGALWGCLMYIVLFFVWVLFIK